jgi:diguanylate cyclase (GGDEF)-like protein
MEHTELTHLLQHIGKDPSRLVFEDELTGIYNRRFLYNYFQHRVAWNNLHHPVSLLMMDLDHFKDINDTYGHQVGDQALVWLADVLKTVAGNQNLAIRYAGDEFMILIPQGDKDEGLRIGNQVLNVVRTQPLRIDTPKVTLRISVSIGVATAPDDAGHGRGLINEADTALYYAKKTGRNRMANAAEIARHEVFDKTVLQQLQAERVVGRRMQLAQIADALKQFSKGRSQFIMIDGGPGMGKSAFLRTMRRNLAQGTTLVHVMIHGNPQEMRRPYYLATDMVVELLKQGPDKVSDFLGTLSPRETKYLGHLLPQLVDAPHAVPDEPESELREAIFNTLVHVIPKAVSSRPLVLLIDDLHFSDEATLLLLRQLVSRKELPVFICGSRGIDEKPAVAQGPPPLEQFYARYGKELGIRRIPLTPLSAGDIVDSLNRIFPGVTVPLAVAGNLARMTRGNPLFLVEILRKLVEDGKLVREDDQLKILPLEDGYVPTSLEEVIGRKIASLDDETRQLIYRASVIGQEIPLSVLSGSSREMETKVLDFVDQAAEQGLINTEFHADDETIRFLGRRILEIAYQTIQEDQKRNLHGQIADYTETLYKQRLLPSAASVAYHYLHSANQEKAATYEQMQTESDARVFDGTQAIYYTGERRKEVTPPGTPLTGGALAQVPTFIRSFLTAVRSYTLYPKGSKTVVTALRQLKESTEEILLRNPELSLFQINHALVINGQKIDVTEFRSNADALVKLLDRSELKGITFRRGASDREVSLLIEALAHLKSDAIHRHFWQRFSKEHHLHHVELQQVRYTIMVEADPPPAEGQRTTEAQRVSPTVLSSQLLAHSASLDREDVRHISDILRAFLSAARSIKLYPTKSTTIARTIDQLRQSLHTFLVKKKVLSLAPVGDALIVNGTRLDTAEFESLADSFFTLLHSVMLTSVTFLEHVTARELKSFLQALAGTDAGIDHEFWPRFAKAEGFNSIVFNEIFYESRVTGLSVPGGPEEETPDNAQPRPLPRPHTPSEELVNALRQTTAAHVEDLLLKNEGAAVQALVGQLFKRFHELPFVTRKKIVASCGDVWNSLGLSTRQRFSALAPPTLLVPMEKERDPRVVQDLSDLLHDMAFSLIQLGNYPEASHILLRLHRRQRQLEDEGSRSAQHLATILNKGLEPSASKLIREDLTSHDTQRQNEAAQLLGSLGKASIPVLLETIKGEEDYRTRQIAARLVAEKGAQATALVKRELVLDHAPGQRRRLLEVVDIITHDIKNELALVLTDGDPDVRRAAFELAERIPSDDVISLLLTHLDNGRLEVAVAAAEALANVKPPAAVPALCNILTSTRQPERLIAACKSLGQIGDPSCIDSLFQLVSPRGLLSLGRKPNPSVRAAAAYALANITDPRVEQLFTSLIADRDPTIAEIARTLADRMTTDPVRPRSDSR